MKLPHKIYLNFTKEDLYKTWWSSERVTEEDAEYLNGETAFPVFDILERHLKDGANIIQKNGSWCLVNDKGNIATGETIRELLINLVFGEL